MPSPDPLTPADDHLEAPMMPIPEHLARTVSGSTITMTPDPIRVPPPPEDAPREQLMEFGAVCGAGALYQPVTRRIILAYLSRWHPDHEALR